jgi:putative aminopeptidase FrvX
VINYELTMTLDEFELLRELCETLGPVGREQTVQEKVKQHLVRYCTEIKQDKIGNLIASMSGNRGRFAVVAHADEVGFLVSMLEEKGFIRAKWNTTGYL